jgi:diadenosine tetraphosphate (Ap4A) HIT family hydrolase
MNNKRTHQCIFCSILNQNKNEIIIDNKFAFAIYDNFPVSTCHCLIIPKRHVESYFDIDDNELLAINDLLKICKEKILINDCSVKGFNVGINIGETAGQSVFHVHIHLIPRRTGDVYNPKGGVRSVIPSKQQY